MHMADALISPGVGITMGLISAGLVGYSAKKIKQELKDEYLPLMGVMGAFIFAAQMINFTIPGTGSSGHLGGGLLLAAVLGPYAGFIAITTVLIIQALFFADGGLLALGCNIFNMGFFTCFVGYPFIYKAVLGENNKRLWLAGVLSVVISLQLGAFSVVLETLFSGRTQLPFKEFVLLMQPIHLAIGLAEGLVTVGIINYVYRINPQILHGATTRSGYRLGRVVWSLAVITVVTAGALSLFASELPDGLEWSIGNIVGETEMVAEGAIYDIMSSIQEKLSIFPDYNFSTPSTTGTSVAGITGAGILFAVLLFAGKFLQRI